MNKLLSKNARVNPYNILSKQFINIFTENANINKGNINRIISRNFIFKANNDKDNLIFGKIIKRNFSEERKLYNPFRNRKKKNSESNNVKEEPNSKDNDPKSNNIFYQKLEEKMEKDRNYKEYILEKNMPKKKDPDDFLQKVIKENTNKKLTDYISEELEQSTQEKYKDINFNYFKQKEIFTRSHVYGFKNKIEQAAINDPEWSLNLHRKFLQRNFLKRNNIFYDFEKDQFDEKRINYEFLKDLKLEEPVIIYECYLNSLKRMYRTKRHFLIYSILLPYFYLNFFFNYDFLFDLSAAQNYGHTLANICFFFWLYNFKLMRFYNKTLITQLKYRGKDDKLIFYVHRGFNDGCVEQEHRADEFDIFKFRSWIFGEYVYFKGKEDDNLLFIMPTHGIYHEKEFFDNLYEMHKVEKVFKKKENKIRNYYDFDADQKEKKLKDELAEIDKMIEEKKNLESTFEERLENIDKKKKEEMENLITKEELERINKWNPKRIFGFGRKNEKENNNFENK